MPITQPMRVLFAHVHAPARFAGHDVYLLRGDLGLFSAAIRPLIFSTDGPEIILAREIDTGSMVRIFHEGPTMRAIEIISRPVVNPFLDT